MFKISVNGKEPDMHLIVKKTNGEFLDLGFQIPLDKGENKIRIYHDSNNRDNAHYTYQRMGDELIKSGRDIVFSVCEWGKNDPHLWAQDVGHLWRTTYDINHEQGVCDWPMMMSIYEHNVQLSNYSSKNAYNDPDMLAVGLKGMNNTMDISHFSLWAIMNSPLMIGADIRKMTEEQLKVVTNKDVLAINQDDNVVQGVRVQSQDKKDIILKPLANGDVAVLFFNKDNKKAQTISYDLKKAGQQVKLINEQKWNAASQYSCREVWTNQTSTTAGVLEQKDIEVWGTKLWICSPK